MLAQRLQLVFQAAFGHRFVAGSLKLIMESPLGVIDDYVPDVIGDQMAMKFRFERFDHLHLLAAYQGQHPASEILLSGVDQRLQDIIILTRHTRTTPRYVFLREV